MHIVKVVLLPKNSNARFSNVINPQDMTGVVFVRPFSQNIIKDKKKKTVWKLTRIFFKDFLIHNCDRDSASRPQFTESGSLKNVRGLRINSDDVRTGLKTRQHDFSRSPLRLRSLCSFFFFKLFHRMTQLCEYVIVRVHNKREARKNVRRVHDRFQIFRQQCPPEDHRREISFRHFLRNIPWRSDQPDCAISPQAWKQRNFLDWKRMIQFLIAVTFVSEFNVRKCGHHVRHRISCWSLKIEKHRSRSFLHCIRMDYRSTNLPLELSQLFIPTLRKTPSFCSTN